jgi:DNA-binding response OmpR family regulator
MKKAKILILEDDIELNETLSEYLQDQDYDVVSVYDGISAQERLYEEKFELLLLDVNVPKPNGFELLREARKNSLETPAIFMTTRSSIDDLEEGYRSGADDYIRKPFELKELKLRIESMLKRNYFHAKNTKMEISQNIFYDTDTNELYIDDKIVPLGEKESRLLKLFIQKRSQLLTHEVIISHLWDYDEKSSDSALRTYIKNLRKLLGKDSIVSHKRLGYQFR